MQHNTIEDGKGTEQSPVPEGGLCSRREFLRLAALAGATVIVGGGLGGVLAACGEEETTTTVATAGDDTTTTAAGAVTTTVSTGQEVTSEAKIWKYGLIGALTGSASGWSIPCQKGTELAVEQINTDGGQLTAGKDPNGGPGFVAKNGQRYKIELTEFDGRFDPKTEVEGTLKMAGDGVLAIIGYRNGCAAVQEITEPAKIINILPGVPPDGTPEGIKYSYAVQWAQVTGTLYPQAMGGPGDTEAVFTNVETCSIVTENEAAPVPVRDMFVERVEAKGIKVVVNETVASDTTDFHSVIAKLIDADPDLHFHNILGLTPAQFYPQAQELGFSTAVMLSEDAIGTRPSDTRKAVGTGYIGVVEPYWLAPFDQEVEPWIPEALAFEMDKREKFIQDFTNKFGTEYLAGGAIHDYDLTHAFFNNVAQAENPEDGAAIADQINKMIPYQGAAWNVIWYPQTHRLVMPVILGGCSAIDVKTGDIKLDWLAAAKPTSYEATEWDITLKKQIDMKKGWSDYWSMP